MDLEEIYLRLKELEKLIDPLEINLIRSYISGFLIDFEQEDFKLDLSLSTEWIKLREGAKSDKQATMMQEIAPTYRRSKEVKLLIKQLSRMRQDLRQRLEIIMSVKPYLRP